MLFEVQELLSFHEGSLTTFRRRVNDVSDRNSKGSRSENRDVSN